MSQRGYGDNVLHHQIDDMIWFDVGLAAERPIHYKVMLPVAISVDR